MYNHNKAQQSKNRVHISWDVLYVWVVELSISLTPRAVNEIQNQHIPKYLLWILFVGMCVLDVL